MKSLLSFFLLIILSSYLYALDLQSIRNTTWELREIGGDGSGMVRFIFGESGATWKLLLTDKDGSEAVLAEATADILKYEESSESVGIHKNQPVILGYDKKKPDKPILGLYVKDDNCLLLPDTEAPDDCLKRVK